MTTQNIASVSQFRNNSNSKLYDRNVPSQMLQPYIDFRPVVTKYTYFPIVDSRKENEVTLSKMPTYDVRNVFNPSNTLAPWSGFVSNINTESELRNQIFALQKCNQKEYVPNSTSDLFVYNFNTQKTQTTHDLLFDTTTPFSQFNPNPDERKIGNNLFMNQTRVQLKDLTK